METLSVSTVWLVINGKRVAALANARSGLTESIREEAKAQAHALTLVLRELGLEPEDDGRQVQPSAKVDA